MLLELTAIGCAGLAGYIAVSGDDAGRRLGTLFPAAHRSVPLQARQGAAGAGRRAGRGRSATEHGHGAAGRDPGSADGRPGMPGTGPEAATEGENGRRALVVSLLAGLVCALLLGGPVGWVAGVLVAVGLTRSLARLESGASRIRRARVIAELPIAVDLLAACLRGGGAWHESVEAVAGAIGGPLGAELTNVAARIRLGADPAAEWLALANDPLLAPLGRAAARAASGGAPLAATLARLARDQRRVARAAAATRARSAGVRAVAPLGLCFLPAFILLGIVPAIAGIAATVVLP